jgi:hypothetical protein
LHPAYVSKDDFALIQTVNDLEAEQETLAELNVEDGVAVERLPKATRDWLKANFPAAEEADRKMLARRTLVIQRELQAKAGRADGIYTTAKQQQLSDLALGRKIRMEREAARKAAAATSGVDGKNKPANAALRTAARPVATSGDTRRGGIDQKKLAEGGNTVEALIEAM